MDADQAVSKREEVVAVLGQIDEARIIIDNLLDREECSRFLEEARLESNQAPLNPNANQSMLTVVQDADRAFELDEDAM